LERDKELRQSFNDKPSVDCSQTEFEKKQFDAEIYEEFKLNQHINEISNESIMIEINITKEISKIQENNTKFDDSFQKSKGDHIIHDIT